VPGANTAIFSIVNAVLLRPLPFRDPNQVMFVWEKIPKRGIDRVNLCPANFLDLQEKNQSFATMAMMVRHSC
jgi:putative ABC transport system permease protein